MKHAYNFPAINLDQTQEEARQTLRLIIQYLITACVNLLMQDNLHWSTGSYPAGNIGNSMSATFCPKYHKSINKTPC